MTEVQMWEVRAATGRVKELLSWVIAAADPAARIYVSGDGEPGSAKSDSEQDARVVVITADVSPLADPPADLVARPAHSWPFRLVRGT